MIRLLIFGIALALFATGGGTLRGAEFTLKDGTVVKGEPVAPNDKGVIIKAENGTLGTRIDWNRFTQEALKEFAKNPRVAKVIENLLDSPSGGEGDKEDNVVVPDKPKKVIPVARDYPKPDRNAPLFGFMSGFSTGIGVVMLLVLYGANIYAGHEIAIFRRRPKALVCGVAAGVPVVGPLLFLCLPTIPEAPINQMKVEAEPAAPAAPEPKAHGAPKKGGLSLRSAAAAPAAPAAHAAEAEAAPEGEAAPEAEAPPPPPAAPAVKLPTYKRGEFTINRRFVETKLSSFLKVVPSEAEKGLVCVMKTARGEFIGRRITKITPADITLAIGDENAYYDQLITYNDILEIEIRHKDA
ncbi:hypothetical protein LBMAG56_09550 [Verrucomicrobiota bacterium]|nr:hypothetical protein LBMAG56_09550 [Verrucomicrobiota bacterium]